MIIPRPTYTEQAKELNDGPDYDYVRWYISCKNWTCVKCGAVMFGRVKYCVYCKIRLGTHTARPTDYVEDEYDAKSSV
jgi:hypothetical protein